jgi:hypothetical protein
MATISVMIGEIDTLGPSGITPIQIYRHTGMKNVVYTQRITHIVLRCPDVHACDTVSTGESWTVFADALDSLNQPLYVRSGSNGNSANGPAEAAFMVRDPTVARATSGNRASTVTALKSGSTWIVASRGLLLDSLQLVVR